MVKKIILYSVILVFAVFIILSLLYNFNPGLLIYKNFELFVITFFKILPPVFILIGLFNVWVKRETVEKHLGDNNNHKKSIFWALLLSTTIVGGLYTALPIAHSLHKKGARPLFVYIFLGASCVLRVPMTIFETTILGIKFTLIRLLLVIPFIIITSFILEKYYKRLNKVSR